MWDVGCGSLSNVVRGMQGGGLPLGARSGARQITTFTLNLLFHKTMAD